MDVPVREENGILGVHSLKHSDHVIASKTAGGRRDWRPTSARATIVTLIASSLARSAGGCEPSYEIVSGHSSRLSTRMGTEIRCEAG